MTEEMLRRDIKDEVDSKHATTDTDIGSKHATTDTLVGSKHTTTETNVKTDIDSKHATTDTDIDSKHATTDTLVGSKHTTTETNVKTDIDSKHATTDTDIDSKHATTDTLVGSKHTTTETNVKTDIDSKHATTDVLVGSKHTTTETNVKTDIDSKHSTTDTLIGSKHTTTQSKIATISAKVGTQLAYMKKYLYQGVAKLTADALVYNEEQTSVFQTATWTLMGTKVIDGPESESKLIESVFVDLGWKHMADKESPAGYTKWVASHLATGTGIAATAPDLTDSVLTPSTAFATVHRSGAVKLAGMNKLPLKLALVGKASVSNGSKVEASIMSDCLVELVYTI